MANPKKVALFMYNYPFSMSASAINTAVVLAENGFRVDVFLYRTRELEAPPVSHPNIRVHNLSPGSRHHAPPPSAKPADKLNRVRPIGRIKEAIKALVGRRFLDWVVRLSDRLAFNLRRTQWVGQPVYSVIPKSVFLKVTQILGDAPCHCFVGIESGGLIFAGQVGQMLGVPFLYYSLELYLSMDPPAHDPSFNVRKKLERTFHQQSLATIIQDQARGKLLCEDNNTQTDHLFYVPVCMLGPAVRKKETYFHERFQMHADQKILLCIGYVDKARKSQETIKGAQSLPVGFTLVLHGIADDAWKKLLPRIDTGNRAILSTDLVPLDRVQSIVSSADVGLVFYDEHNLNTFHTGLASDKMARFMRSGIPVIVSDFPSFRKVIDRYRCGICVSSPLQINDALEAILDDYATYRKAAFECYAQQYEFRKQFAPVVDFIAGLPAKKEVAHG